MPKPTNFFIETKFPPIFQKTRPCEHNLSQERERLAQAQEASAQVQAEAEREAATAEKKLAKAEARIEVAEKLNITYDEIEQMGKKTLPGNYTFTPTEASTLKTLVQKALSSRTKLYRLGDALAKAKLF